MDYDLSDKILQEALLNVDRYELSLLPDDNEINHMFSKSFIKKMNKLIRQSKRNGNYMPLTFFKKRFVAVLVAGIITIGSAISVYAARKYIYKFFTEIYEKYTHIFFKSDNTKSNLDFEFQAYSPAYIPDGFKLTLKNINTTVLLVYENTNQYISYSQIKLDEASLDINTENVRLENIKFLGLPAKYYSNCGIQNLIWHDDHYMFSVSTTLPKEDLFEICESIKPINNK